MSDSILVLSSNQQIYPVFIGSMLGSFVCFLLQIFAVLNPALVTLCLGLFMAAWLLSFAYLIFLTATYEKTKSYAAAKPYVDHLALISTVETFIGLILLILAVLLHLVQNSNSAGEYAMTVASAMLFIASFVLAATVGQRWASIPRN